MNLKKAIQWIDEKGALLIFPIKNAKEPPSLWSCFFPRSKMLWEWDEDGDHRVGDLWFLREKLSSSGKVVYTKWYRGRATVFSRPLFEALLTLLRSHERSKSLPPLAGKILKLLREDSPVSSKLLKKEFSEASTADFQRALKTLWEALLIVGYGEVDDGAFPSLAIGASNLLFEDEWKRAEALSEKVALDRLQSVLPSSSPFFVFFQKLQKRKAASFRNPPSVKLKSRLAPITWERLSRS